MRSSGTRLNARRAFLRAAAVGEERRARHEDDAGLDRAAAEVGRVAARKRQPGEEAAARVPPLDAVRQLALERGAGALPTARVENARALDPLVEQAAAPVLLEQPLREPARALVGRLLRPRHLRDQRRGAARPPEPRSGHERLRERPDLDDGLRRERPQARKEPAVEAELAVGDVLDDEEAEATRDLDEHASPLERQRDTGRVLVLGDHVQELRTQAATQLRLERVRHEAVAVERDRHRAGVEPIDDHQRTEIGRRLDRDDVAVVEERLREQLEPLHPAARHHQLAARRGGDRRASRHGRRGTRASTRGRSSGRTGRRARRVGGELARDRGDALRRERASGRAARRRTRSGPAGPPPP